LKGGQARKAPTKENDTTIRASIQSSAAVAPGHRRGLVAILAGLVDRWVATAIAHYEREAGLAMLRRLSDRELKDIGVCRCDIGEALADAAHERMRRQRAGRLCT
jgi:uncharacterized protein YjiS (DUF1127 family)